MTAVRPRTRPMARRGPPVRRRPGAFVPVQGAVVRRLLACAGLLLMLALVGGALNAGLRPSRPLPRPPIVSRGLDRPGVAASGAARVAGTPAPSVVRVTQVAAANEGALPVVAPPSVSAAVIDAALTREGSPLAGQGAYIVAAGRRAGVDPVFLLAFVSHFDLSHPLPAQAHNVGHIRAGAGEPAVDGYRAYPTWQAGVDAWYGLIRDRYARQWGLRTLDAIVPVYAPSTQAGVEAEMADLRAMVAAWRADNNR